MNTYILDFTTVDKTKLTLAGGKGANLGELCNIQGIRVPGGFCVTTEAFKKVITASPLINELLDQLLVLKLEDRNKISELSSNLRKAIEDIDIPTDIVEDITRHLLIHGEGSAYAVRSSSTAEDLPTASFAGQQDSYLNIIGTDAILKHISKCWASLYTERAVIYRIQNGYDHHKVYLAVVVQKMIFPKVSGIMFTADPVTGNRRVLSVDASFGLGEALVSGIVNADVYKVRNGVITDIKTPAKKLAVYAVQGGGTSQQEIAPAQQTTQALTDEQVLQLEGIGRKIEAHFGRPQDIEWCLADNTFYIVQSRPITTLFPIPEVADNANHVYISVGHQQMMTDAMKPLGISVRQLTTARPMSVAGGRMFADVAKDLASPVGRHMIINVLGNSDPLIKDALTTIIERGDFIPALPGNGMEHPLAKYANNDTSLSFKAKVDNDPAIITGLINRGEEAMLALKRDIQSKSGVALIDFIQEDFKRLQQFLFEPNVMGVIMDGMNASAWVNEKVQEWLGEKNVADTLSQSVPNNITAEMGRDLLDVADAFRPYPEVVAYLQQIKGDGFLAGLPKVDGGQQAYDAVTTFLNKYGMRCAGEIDITKPRWAEKPGILAPVILSNIKNFVPGAGKQKFAQGLQEAVRKEHDLLAKLHHLPGGDEKAAQLKYAIDVIRNFSGYREYPKYHIVSRYAVYKQALLQEAGQLVKAGVLGNAEDIYYQHFEELREAISNHSVNYDLINQRKAEFALYEKLSPPRVMTSDGEIINGTYNRDNIPVGAIAGLAVSSGVIEGRARVIFSIDAEFEEGDILVTPFTDPSWTPLFFLVKGLVTEVGGLMTHGSVIAREYGLPAVVGVDNATKIIKDGQRIRVNGTDGYIEIL